MNLHLLKFSYVALCTVLVAIKASAADYTAGFSFDTQTSHNNNIRLVQSDKTAATKYNLSPKLTLGVNTETNKLELDSSVDFNRYNRSEFNSDDQNIALTFSHQFENSSLGLSANYIHNSTNTSELLTSGRIGNKADRAEQYTVSPNWIYTVTETNLIQLLGTYTSQNYGNNAYIGYRDIGSELDWIHLIDDRTKVVVAATYSDYKSDDITLEVPAFSIFIFPYFFDTGSFGQQSYAVQTKSKGAEVGVDYQLSEQSVIKARLGRSQNRTNYIVDTNNICTNAYYQALVATIGPIGAACDLQATSGPQTTSELDWLWSNERHQLNLNASKAIQPTSNGYAVDATQIGGNWSYQLSELNKILVSTSLVRNRAINSQNSVQNASIADRDYGSATLQYQRQLSEYWAMNASFQFSEQKYTQIDYRASSKVYSLGISYRPQQWHWAR